MQAYNEAKSLRVGKLCNTIDSGLNNRQQWEAFFLLSKMLEEYGTHLAEAAWSQKFGMKSLAGYQFCGNKAFAMIILKLDA